MKSVDQDILKPREISFATYLALGHEQGDAYRRAFKAKRLKPDVILNRASRLAREQRIVDRVAACVAEIKLEQLDSIGKAYSDLLSSLGACKEAKNWTAYASLCRLRLQCLGMLKENINITAEQRLTDEQIVDRVAAKDPQLRAQLKLVVGSGDAYST